MTPKGKQKTLERAIEIAIKNGWTFFGYTIGCDLKITAIDPIRRVFIEWSYDSKEWAREWAAEEIIFNHDFARALWQDYMMFPACGHCGYIDKAKHDWQHHLQQMVIAEDPIAYLSENMPHDRP